jgi:hypothetical protein
MSNITTADIRGLHCDLSDDLDAIKRRFAGNPKVTLIVRFEDAPGKGLFLSDDDFELAIAQVRSLQVRDTTVRIDPIPGAER